MAGIVSVIVAIASVLRVTQNATQVAMSALRTNSFSPPCHLGMNGSRSLLPQASLHDGVNELVKKVVRGHLMRANVQVSTGQIFFDVPIDIVMYTF